MSARAFNVLDWLGLMACSPSITVTSSGTSSFYPYSQYVGVNVSTRAVSGYNPSVCQLANGVGYVGGPAPSVSVNTLQNCPNGVTSCTAWTQLNLGSYWVESTSASSLDTNAVIYLPQPGSYTFVVFYGYEYNGSVYSVGSYTWTFTYTQPSPTQPSTTLPSSTTPTTTPPSPTESWLRRYWWVIPVAAGGAVATALAIYMLTSPPPEEVYG